MKIKLEQEIAAEKQEMRKAFCDTLLELAKENEDIVVLDADLMGAMGTKPFEAAYPERTIDCGIQEANMIGVAAGLSATGKIPFAHTFAAFASRRAFDQVFLSGAYAKSNIKVIGSDPGITAQINGGTHMPFEDMGLMCSVPEMTVIEPTDITMLKWAIREMAGTYGMHYMRLVRKSCMKVYADDSEFDMNHAVTLREGKDATIIASGYCVAEAVKAGEMLKDQGVDVRILNVFCWKPIDKEAIIRAAKETKAIVTAENHNVMTGLGAAVAGVVVKNAPVPMEMIGIQDEFGEVGYVDYLSERFELNAKHIAKAVLKVIERKVCGE